MPIDPQYLSALDELYRTKQVAPLDDLREALHTPSRTTVFRVLSATGYLTSYSHAGRYYTLKHIPKFDSNGIWLHRGIGFSRYGTLRATVIHLVEISPAGQTHSELQNVLQLRVHDTLRLVIQDHALTRKQFQDAYLYLSSKAKRASAQWTQRQQLAAAAVPEELEPSRVIDVLLAFPGLLLAIALVAVLGPSLRNVLFALTVIGWVGYARLVRGQVLRAREFEYVQAARALGALSSSVS